jgi:hypothetical protein
MTKRHAKPTSAKKRKAPTTAQMVGRIPKWLMGFEERINNKLALMSLNTTRNANLLQLLLYDSKEAREDNLPTLPRLHRAIESGEAHLRVTARTLVDHCSRLLKEKETLQRQVERMKIDGAPTLAAARAAHMTANLPTLNFEMRQYPCGCSATGNGVQPLPDYCGTHGVVTDSVITRHRVQDAHEKLAADVLNFGFDTTACTLAHLHRPGIRCGVCGETPDGFSAPVRKV